MPVTKHTLTLGKDTITGVSGVDLFVAPAGTLNSLDVLEGGGGVDTIAVDMITTFAHPTLKHIEKAIFTHTGAIAAGLDLINAKQLVSVEFDAFKSDATIKNADVVNEIILNNDDNHKISILDIDTTKVALQKISALNSTDESLNIQTDGNLGIHKLDVTLNNSKLYLGGDTAATELVIHSISKDDNTLLYHTDGSQQSIQKVTVDGSAALNFGITQTMAFRSMTRFDASQADGAINTQFDGTKLDYVRGGSDNDAFTFYDLGGTTAKKANVGMGAGADQVWINQSIFDSKTMTLNGNEGFDTFSYNGVDKGLAAGLVSFEKLTLENISGTYQLDGEFTDLKLYDSTNNASVTTFKGGTGLVNVTGSFENDRVSLEALGGTAAAKAHVNLIGGNDMLLVDHLALKAGSQVFDGGTGHDGVAFSGNVANIGATFQNFEYAYMYDMHGTYDFTDSGISGLIFGNVPTGAMTINGLQTGSVIQIGAAQTTIMNVNVEDALSSKTESLIIDLYGNADFGNSTFGLIAPGLSNLIVDSSQLAHKMFITQLGSASDYATLYATGSSKLSFAASNGASLYIDEIRSTNSAGVDMLGLLNGTKALSASGVTVVAGSGSDVLVGGKGVDHIITGGGNNDIHGSLGQDFVDITGGGLDEFIFNNYQQSKFGSGDHITGFNIFDSIDISDIVSSVSFGGNAASYQTGLATLSSSHSVGFFSTSNHTLYVDTNADGALDSLHDMAFHLDGLNSFNSTSLIC